MSVCATKTSRGNDKIEKKVKVSEVASLMTKSIIW